MPIYLYNCSVCKQDSERITTVDNRDEQVCTFCGDDLDRQIAFTGLTWAPTAGGYR